MDSNPPPLPPPDNEEQKNKKKFTKGQCQKEKNAVLAVGRSIGVRK